MGKMINEISEFQGNSKRGVNPFNPTQLTNETPLTFLTWNGYFLMKAASLTV